MKKPHTQTTYALALAALSAGTTAQDIDNPAAIASDEDTWGVQFITPARMASSYLDSPNSVTSLDTATLRKLGIVNFSDAMRLVPGMQVSQTHGSDESVGYHGANVNVPRRTEILYNSNHLYRPGYAAAHWARLPLDIRDLSSIEVTRGPTLEYGPNGMTSTVNFIQDSPATRGLDALVRVGEGGIRDVYLEAGTEFRGSQVGARYFHRESSGFDSAENFEGRYNNDLDSDSLMLNLEYYLNPTLLLDFAASFIDSTYTVPGFNNITNSDEATESASDTFFDNSATQEKVGFMSTKLHTVFKTDSASHDVAVGVNYNYISRDQKLSLCPPGLLVDPLTGAVWDLPSVEFSLEDRSAFFTALITGQLNLEASLVAPPSASDQLLINQLGKHIQNVGPAIFVDYCGSTNQDFNEERWEIETHVVSHLSQNIQNSFGISASFIDANSDTYFGRNVTQQAVNIYDNVRFSPTDKLIVNAAFSADTVDTNTSDITFSYRVAANYLAHDNLIVRLMNARVQRTPDLHETQRNWTYKYTYLPGVTDHLGRSSGTSAQRSLSNENLNQETLQSTELGITYRQGEKLLIDSKVFYEDYSDLISEPFLAANFNLTNNGTLRNSGAEFSVRHTPSRDFYWGASYAYLDSKSNNPFEQTLRARHTGSVWAVASLSEDWDVSAAFYGASKVANGSYDRYDLTLSHISRFSSGSIALQLNYRRYPNGINAFTEISFTEPNVALIEGRDRFLVSVQFTPF
jgi:iron complex outermembrane receptor protein